MRISVVIATRNRAPLLQETLAQLRRQRFAPGDEVIVVDNGSTDGTGEVLRQAAAEFPVSFMALRELASGKSPALNAGISASSGDVLALTDDDVIVADDWLEQIRRVFADPALALAGGRVDPRWERPAPRWLRVEQDGRYNKLAAPLALLHYGEPQALGRRTAVGANLAVRRALWESLGGFAVHLGRREGTLLCGEDHDFCQRAVAAGYRCEYRPELRVRHWVPAARARLSYHLRWFYWLGVTNAILERDERAGTDGGPVPLYLVRRLVTAPLAALGYLARGRSVDGISALTDAAYALGNLAERVRGRREPAPTPAAAGRRA